MMSGNLVGGASTQSRGRRPLPRDAVRGVTLETHGVAEIVRFECADGSWYRQSLLSWVVGQSGLLWAGGSYSNIPGPAPLHQPPAIHIRIRGEIEESGFESSGSYGHDVEQRLADLLCEIYAPYIDGDLGVRFFQSGGEACAAAVRVARAATEREMIASCGYHGAALDFAHEPDYRGQPLANVDLNLTLDFGDVPNMRRGARKAACLIVEVLALDDDEMIAAFLHDCRPACDEFHSIFILDEVVTGFRLGLGGACERYHVKPDIVCLGKAMSATGCISAVVGKRDLVGLLDKGVFYSTTFGGSPGPCRVALNTLSWLRDHRGEVYGADGHLQRIGSALKDGFNARGVPCIGQPERSVFAFPSDEEWLSFCSRMIEHGVMVHRPNFVTLAHSFEDVTATMRAVEAVTHEH